MRRSQRFTSNPARSRKAAGAAARSEREHSGGLIPAHSVAAARAAAARRLRAPVRSSRARRSARDRRRQCMQRTPRRGPVLPLSLCRIQGGGVGRRGRTDAADGRRARGRDESGAGGGKQLQRVLRTPAVTAGRRWRRSQRMGRRRACMACASCSRCVPGAGSERRVGTVRRMARLRGEACAVERLPQVLGTSVSCWGCAQLRASSDEDSRWWWRMRRRRRRRHVLRVVLKSAAGAGAERCGRYTGQAGRAVRGRDEGGGADDERERHALPVRLAVWSRLGGSRGGWRTPRSSEAETDEAEERRPEVPHGGRAGICAAEGRRGCATIASWWLRMSVAPRVWLPVYTGRAAGVWGCSCVDGSPGNRRGDASIVAVRRQKGARSGSEEQPLHAGGRADGSWGCARGAGIEERVGLHRRWLSRAVRWRMDAPGAAAVVSHIPVVPSVEGVGVVVGSGCGKQAGSGFVVAERIAFGVVLVQKAGAGGRQCCWSRCMSYTTLRRGRKERLAPRKVRSTRRRGKGGRKTVGEKRTDIPLASFEFADAAMQKRKGLLGLRSARPLDSGQRWGGVDHVGVQPGSQVPPATKCVFASAENGLGWGARRPRRRSGARRMPLRNLEVTLRCRDARIGRVGIGSRKSRIQLRANRGLETMRVGDGIVRAWKSTPRESSRAWRQWLQSEAWRLNGSRGDGQRGWEELRPGMGQDSVGRRRGRMEEGIGSRRRIRLGLEGTARWALRRVARMVVGVKETTWQR
ncbi:hypothetical protein FB451DRAFT_1196375 [Mycena latifolia]|nr:hypothetical protein FB451DRAFT_1196375 [Mycena latifolia]